MNQSYSYQYEIPHNLTIETPPLIALRDAIGRLVYTNAVGAAVLGFSRAGKTRAIQTFPKRILSRSGKVIPSLTYSVPRRDRTTIASLYLNMTRHFCLASGYRVDPERHSDQLATYIAECVQATGSQQCLLFVDEAQRLGITQMDIFSELHDKLERGFEISLIVVFVGNKEEMQTLLKSISRGENQHLAGRFFRHIIEFHGLRSQQDVRYCLAQFDKIPHPSSGVPYTQTFIPNDYNAGFRLESTSQLLWEEFRMHQIELELDSWGMESFISTIIVLLSDYLAKFSADEETLPDMISKSMDAVKLSSDLVTMY